MTNIGIMELAIVLLICLVGLAVAAGIGVLIYMRTRSKPAVPAMAPCPNCGKDVAVSMQFCPHCGSRIMPPVSS